jgi:Glycosyl-transferase for dystroglycan
MRLKKAKLARPYHKKAFSLNQRSTNFSRWEKIGAGNVVSVAYPVDKFIFHYEPVYVAKRGTPPFSERYVGYGMTRNTQAYEMLLANYTFYVLDNAFLNHWGFQLKRIQTSRTKFRQVTN